MRQRSDPNAGLWELTVLALLRERPMHPYEIQRLIKERHKDDVLVLKRGSLYHAIGRLAGQQFIVAQATTREGLRPERTTYALTPAGQEALLSWLRRRIAQPPPETSNFMGSLSYLVHLEPSEAIAALEQRCAWLTQNIALLGQTLHEALPRAGRINLIESEYLRAMQSAELKWVRGLLSDLRSTRLHWDIHSLLKQLRSLHRETSRAHRRPKARRASSR